MKQVCPDSADPYQVKAGGRFASFVAMLLLAISLPSGAATPADAEFDNAVQSFRTGNFSAAYGQFQDLATRGDEDAARIALFMSNYGPLLYGKQWDAMPQDKEYWNILARSNRPSLHPAPQFKPLVVTKKKPAHVAATAKKPAAAGVELISTRSE